MLRHLADALLSAVFAPPCAACARVIDHPLEGAVCSACWDAIEPAPTSTFRVGHCATGCAIGAYDGVLRDIIHALKYNGRRSVAPRLSQLMAKHAGEVLRDADVVVPVPLHPKRQRQRGFNQSDDLARGLGLPVVRVLRRTRSTRPQVDLPADARRLNVLDAFCVRQREGFLAPSAVDGLAPGTGARLAAGNLQESPVVSNKIVILVDDVITTGATLEACARMLLSAGAREVRALTAARVATGPR